MNMTRDVLAAVPRVSLIAVVFLITAQFSFARDTGFLPGDAFFQCLITTESCGEIQENDSIVFREHHWHGTSGMNAYLGFQQIRITSSGKTLQNQIQDAYAKLCQIRSSPEKNDGAILLMYNRNFDPRVTPLGLRYNERWIKKKEGSFMYPSGYYHIEWESSPEAVFYDLSQAPLIDKLSIEYSQGEEDATKEHDKPYTVHANFQDLKFVLIERKFFEKMHFVRYKSILMQMGDDVDESGPTSVGENEGIQRSEGDSEMLNDAELMQMFRERFALTSSIDLKTYNCSWIELCDGKAFLFSTGISKIRRIPLSEVGNGIKKN